MMFAYRCAQCAGKDVHMRPGAAASRHNGGYEVARGGAESLPSIRAMLRGKVYDCKEQEEAAANKGNEPVRDVFPEPLATEDRQARADCVPSTRSHDHAQRILMRRKRYGGYLRAVTPLGEERQHQGLQEDGCAESREEAPDKALLRLRSVLLKAVLYLLKLLLCILTAFSPNVHQTQAEKRVQHCSAAMHGLLRDQVRQYHSEPGGKHRH
mmetsp:Transcript_11976/g.26626  ORF Transcript_11976/g.26626 Transcript_11976/m.26626 type:complete len:211 (+) Transcript_11976:21-653(+)